MEVLGRDLFRESQRLKKNKKSELDEEEKKAVIVSAIDNLVKGASGAAVQNMNLLFGLDETTALTTVPLSIMSNDKFPEPSVTSMAPGRPSESGSVKDVEAPSPTGALNSMYEVPLTPAS